jgi:tRNA (guanine-N7-)-methyltransferase
VQADAAPPHRQLYGRRRGPRLRITRQGALDRRLPESAFSLPEQGPFDPRSLFDGTVEEVWLEIGFGSGEHLAAQARANPNVGLIGVEPFINGVASLMVAVEAEGLRNIRVLTDDARLLLRMLEPESLARIFVLFPDPWPKLRHRKRRIVNPSTLASMCRALRPAGELRMATDDPDYAEAIRRALTAQSGLRPLPIDPRPGDWPPTRYEEKGLLAGRAPQLFMLIREDGSGAR